MDGGVIARVRHVADAARRQPSVSPRARPGAKGWLAGRTAWCRSGSDRRSARATSSRRRPTSYAASSVDDPVDAGGPRQPRRARVPHEVHAEQHAVEGRSQMRACGMRWAPPSARSLNLLEPWWHDFFRTTLATRPARRCVSCARREQDGGAPSPRPRPSTRSTRDVLLHNSRRGIRRALAPPSAAAKPLAASGGAAAAWCARHQRRDAEPAARREAPAQPVAQRGALGRNPERVLPMPAGRRDRPFASPRVDHPARGICSAASQRRSRHVRTGRAARRRSARAAGRDRRSGRAHDVVPGSHGRSASRRNERH